MSMEWSLPRGKTLEPVSKPCCIHLTDAVLSETCFLFICNLEGSHTIYSSFNCPGIGADLQAHFSQAASSKVSLAWAFSHLHRPAPAHSLTFNPPSSTSKPHFGSHPDPHLACCLWSAVVILNHHRHLSPSRRSFLCRERVDKRVTSRHTLTAPLSRTPFCVTATTTSSSQGLSSRGQRCL